MFAVVLFLGWSCLTRLALFCFRNLQVFVLILFLQLITLYTIVHSLIPVFHSLSSSFLILPALLYPFFLTPFGFKFPTFSLSAPLFDFSLLDILPALQALVNTLSFSLCKACAVSNRPCFVFPSIILGVSGHRSDSSWSAERQCLRGAFSFLKGCVVVFFLSSVLVLFVGF